MYTVHLYNLGRSISHVVSGGVHFGRPCPIVDQAAFSLPNDITTSAKFSESIDMRYMKVEVVHDGCSEGI